MTFSLSLLGTFFGAILGLGSALLVQWLQRRNENRASGNLAMQTLSEQLAALRTVRTTVLEEVARHKKDTVPLWFASRPMVGSLKTPLEFDLKSLAFLFDRDIELIGKLAHVERLYATLVALVEAHRDTIAAIQTKLDEAGFRPGQQATQQDLEARLGPDLVAKGNSITEAIWDSCESDEAKIRVVATQLHQAMKAQFIGVWPELRRAFEATMKNTGVIVRFKPSEDPTVQETPAPDATAKGPSDV